MADNKTRVEEVKISVLLRAARAALGISQAELADELGVSQSTIARCERGIGPLPSRALLRSINYFSSYGIDLSGILDEDPTLSFASSFFERAVEEEQYRDS